MSVGVLGWVCDNKARPHMAHKLPWSFLLEAQGSNDLQIKNIIFILLNIFNLFSYCYLYSVVKAMLRPFLPLTQHSFRVCSVLAASELCRINFEAPVRQFCLAIIEKFLCRTIF